MIIGQTDRLTATLAVEIVAGTSFVLLAALAQASKERPAEVRDELAAALDDVGDTAGEAWLNLLGLALDCGSPYTAERLLAELDSIDAVALRLHLLGRHAWSWCTLAGIGDIEAAAGGDGAAADRLLEHPRYYAGHARDSLSTLVALEPEETRRRIRRAVEEGAKTLLAGDARRALEAARIAAAAALAEAPPLDAIEQVALGYRYVPEPEAEHVVLIPHFEHGLPLVLAQHRAARLIVYRATPEPRSETRLLALGRALADPKRIELLALLGRGKGRASDLVEASGLSRSTVHYHLSQLREAGLVTLEGNARAYTYVPRQGAAASVASLIDEVTSAPRATRAHDEGKERT